MKYRKVALIIFALLIVIGSAIIVLKNSDEPTKTPEKTTKTYLAFGDSIAAGTGLQTASDTTACYRYDEGYPQLVAKKLQLELTNVACSGATVKAGLSGSQDINGLAIPAQISTLTSASKPDLITITIGANDLNWTGIINLCYADECDTVTNTSKLAEAVSAYRVNLAETLAIIENRFDQTPQVVVTTYYDVFPAGDGTCSDLFAISTDEKQWWRQQESLFKAAIAETVTKFPFVKLANIDFTGHELCSADPWVQGISDKAPFHPTASGQAAIADAVEAVISF